MNTKTIKIKPLSVNRAYKGRRFRTPEYNAYEKELLYTLPKIDMPEPPYKISYVFGMSLSSDIDNPTKLFQDILCKRYNFDDRYIFEINIKKVKVKKGSEFIQFQIEHYENAH